VQLESAYIFLDLITEANSVLGTQLKQGSVQAAVRGTPVVSAIISIDEEVESPAVLPPNKHGKCLGLKYNVCKQCNRKFKSKKRHEMVFHPKKPNVYKCELACEFSYDSSKSLNQHLQRCHICPEAGCSVLRSVPNLKIHMKKVHNKQVVPMSTEKAGSPATSVVEGWVESSFQCEHCEFKTNSNKG
jgi:predicted transcriptional regulator